ncbi:hypothetical protein OIU77_016656 [Salix suchowensis]|uniref:Uncharacterized protein n=1 Tax=Salix suchowensis TaxID=1278906 RepID=A0ABQ8ZLK7_9ROSI|nr:hypothetical protein OIU77_016656 [Salix suchowensis]
MPPAIICNPLLFISSSFKLPYLRYNIARTQLEERQDSKANTNEKYHNRCTSVQVCALHFALHLQGGERIWQRLQEPNKNVWLVTRQCILLIS